MESNRLVNKNTEFIWASNYMTQNAKDIYDKLIANITLPDVSYLSYSCEENILSDVDDTIRDIANYLDENGVVLS